MCGNNGGSTPRRPPSDSFNRATQRSNARRASNRRAWRSGSSQFVRHHLAQWRRDALWPLRLITHVNLIWRLDLHDPNCPYVALVRGTRDA